MPLRPKSALHPEQQQSIDQLYNNNSALALLPVGAGKTVVGWTAATELMDDGHVKRPIVFAPLRVASIEWPGQRADWEHLKNREMVEWGGEPAAWAPSLWKTSRQLWGQRTSAERRLPNVEANWTKRNDALKAERAALATLAWKGRHGTAATRRKLRNLIILQQNRGLPKTPAQLRKLVLDEKLLLTEHIAGIKAQERVLNKKIRATEPPAVLHCTSYENIEWFCDLYPEGTGPFDLWIFDEIGKLKNPKSPRYKMIAKRTKAVLAAGGIVWGLNATPAPEGMEDLFTQVQIVDGGKLWGPSFYKWRQTYFTPADYMGYDWRPQLGARKVLLEQLNSIAFRVDEKDLSYHKSMQHSQIKVNLPPKARAAYDEMEKHMALAVEGKEDIVAMSAAVASMKLRQITQGFIYDDAKQATILHTEKIDALSDLIDTMSGEPLLVAYEFNEDLLAMRKMWKNIPYIGSGVPASKVKSNIADWNSRKLKVMAIHPQCLHPDTLVLTEYRGWIRLIAVQDDERVFDGVEFVSHSGCRLSGWRAVIDRFGITMTPDHPFLIEDTWVKAEDVPDTADARRAARYAYQGDDPRVGALFELRRGERAAQAERGQEQQREARALQQLHSRNPAQNDGHPTLSDLEGHAGPRAERARPGLQALRWAWHHGVARVAELRRLLARHAGRIFGHADDRAQGRQWPLLQGQLSVGYQRRAAGKQAQQPDDQLPGRDDASGRVLSTGGREPRRDHTLPSTAPDGRCGDAGLPAIELPTGAAQSQAVFDLVDCGPRHRFVVRNADGEAFIVHNSAGHGLNLQHGGSHIAWYCLPWPLENFLQTNGRIDRQGQTRACYGHHIIVRNSMDQRVSDALMNKEVSQREVIEAIRRVGQ